MLTIRVVGEFGPLGEPSALLAQLKSKGSPCDKILAVRGHGPKEIRFMVANDDDARQVRLHSDEILDVLGGGSISMVPEQFYVYATYFNGRGPISRGDNTGGDNILDPFGNPGLSVEAWNRENGLDIKRAYWKRKKLVLVFEDMDQARAAIRRRVTLSGQHTGLTAFDPRSMPRQCFKCMGVNHMKGECRHPDDRCGHCGMNHMTSTCSGVGPKRCAICKGGHKAFSLEVCRHPSVLAMWRECSKWVGVPPWARSAPWAPVDGIPQATALTEEEDATWTPMDEAPAATHDTLTPATRGGGTTRGDGTTRGGRAGTQASATPPRAAPVTPEPPQPPVASQAPVTATMLPGPRLPLRRPTGPPARQAPKRAAHSPIQTEEESFDTDFDFNASDLEELWEQRKAPSPAIVPHSRAASRAQKRRKTNGCFSGKAMRSAGMRVGTPSTNSEGLGAPHSPILVDDSPSPTPRITRARKISPPQPQDMPSSSNAPKRAGRASKRSRIGASASETGSSSGSVAPKAGDGSQKPGKGGCKKGECITVKAPTAQATLEGWLLVGDDDF